MLSLAKIGRGREDYHLRAVGPDASEYYSEHGEVAGLWLGGGAEALGLQGRVLDTALLAVLAGYEPGARPVNGSWIGHRLVAPPRDGQRMPGVDACFKAPKSVSLLWAFGDRVQVGDRTLDRVVELAHDEAVREALSYLEASAAKGRRGYNGLTQVDSSGFVAAAFRQRTSRANDPHLHTHVLIANMCQGSDGKWGALDARLIYAHAKAAGYLYETHLRDRLRQDLGVDWGQVENGIADVAGVPEEMIDLFSKRRREIRGMVVQLATSGAGVECVEAAPGTGKTTALGVYVAAARRAGIGVIGCAPSARARDELRLGARIDACYTVDKLLLELQARGLAPGSIVILDEASMAGSRKLARMLDHAAAAHAKVVLVGDTKQLSSVDAGGGFRGLVARLGAHRLLENRRQVEQWERDALCHLREGRVRAAMTAYAAHGRLHLGDREQLVEAMVDDWWAARESGEAVMQASRWSDVLELNERARERLVQAGLVERDGLDVRGVTIGVGDQVMVLRNDRRLGVINGTLGTVTTVDRERGDLVLETPEAEQRKVLLPRSFWNARGRPRVTLAYCRTIHKAQGATYRGVSFTLAGDDTLHLEATHVALSRGTQANHLYYSGEPPPDEDHHLAEVARPELEGLMAAAGRSRAQLMALDLLEGLGSTPGGPAGSPRDSADAPMTEAQAATLARRGVVPDCDLTWVQTSLLIDDVTGGPRGRQAAIWLRENGASQEEVAQAIERAEQRLRAPATGRLAGAVAVRLEVLETAGQRHAGLSAGQARERESLQRWQMDTARDRQRQRRQAWSHRPTATTAEPPAAPITARRRGASRR